jgi:hypothetical protein
MKMSQRIKRVSSNLDSDAQSIIISGNLSEIPGNVEFLHSDSEEFDFIKTDSKDERNDKLKNILNGPESTLEDYRKANRICDDLYGIDLLDILTKLLINDELDSKEFGIQAVAYKVQSLVRGPSGVR